MFDSAEEIVKLVNQSEQDQSLLFTRMETDQDWAVGKEFTTTKGYEQYTSTKPQNFLAKVLDGLNRAQLDVSIKLADDAEEEERRQASTGELYLLGALADIDRTLMEAGEPPLREGLGYFIAARGWYCLKAVVYVLKGETYFDVQPWDPLHVTYDKGSKGTIWIARKRRATVAQIKAEYDFEPTGTGGAAAPGFLNQAPGHEVIDFFDQERNSVIINQTFIKKPKEFKRDSIPVLHGAVGSMPTMQAQDFIGLLEHRGQSVFSSARHTFEPFNKLVSQLMDVQKKSMVGSLIHQSKLGDKKIKGDPWANYMVTATAEGESIKPMELPLVPEVTMALLGILDTEGQQSMLPSPLSFGGVGSPPPSGRAIALLADATRSVYNPRTEALSRCYVWLGEQLLSQYARHGKARNFQGYTPDGKFFSQQVKPKEIGKGWFVSVKVEPKMPRDLESDLLTAQIATTPSGPNGERLLSFHTAREKIIQLPNPEAESDKILAEFGESLEPIVRMNVAAALVRRGKPEVAKQVLGVLGQQDGATPPSGQQQQQLPPEVIERIAAVFVQAGEEELGKGVLEMLGVLLPPPQEAGPPPVG